MIHRHASNVNLLGEAAEVSFTFDTSRLSTLIHRHASNVHLLGEVAEEGEDGHAGEQREGGVGERDGHRGEDDGCAFVWCVQRSRRIYTACVYHVTWRKVRGEGDRRAARVV